jgi:hypothetical protein
MSDDTSDPGAADRGDRNETGGESADPASASVATAPDPADEDDDAALGPRIRTFLNYGLLAGLLILALVAVVGLYTAVSSAISIWVTREWRPLFRAAFNLVVLLLAGSGIVWQAARMR